MRRLLAAAALVTLAACTDAATQPRSTDLPIPSGLTYQLVPSGVPDSPDGVLLSWKDVTDTRVSAYVVYSRASDGRWQRRAETTSPTFSDAGYPAPEYYVATRDDAGHESQGSASVTIDVRLRMPAPTALTSVSLYRAAQLSWSSASRLSQPSKFDYYRVYSTVWSASANACDNALWVLEGTTISDDFLVTGLTNGVRYCFAVSIVSTDGHESLWSVPRDDTPRYDSRNVILDAFEVAPATSGFDFYNPTANPQFGIVTSGSSTSIDFRLERHSDGLLYFVPMRSDVSIALYSQNPVTDLTSIDIAPLDNAFSSTSISASPGYAYVFRIGPVGSANYAAVRVSHVGADYVILDWSYQSAPNNPELTIGR
ncbi:MAG: hypothetical protein HOQ09_02540 [Gemmatimonadaceae bacterium]|nr:hypothetical protein [Gemmatimonadaceae bacterium]